VSSSAAPSPHVVETNLAGVYAFKQPPADFNVQTASREQLAAWGYPPRPDVSEGPTALTNWLAEVNPAMRRVVPDLVRREGVYHRPVKGLKVTSASVGINAAIAATSSNWSGIALVNGTGDQPFYLITGRWIVPTVKQAALVRAAGTIPPSGSESADSTIRTCFKPAPRPTSFAT
jgi:hypothetical protein